MPNAELTLSIVVPCYNEEQVLPETSSRLVQVVSGLVAEGLVSPRSEIIFVDDGSRDRTWPLICELSQQHDLFKGVKLSRNRGHQNALLAGLFHAQGDAVISVDADLQDDLAAIREMVVAHRGGAEVVYGVRRSRATDTGFKRFTAEGYYKVLALLKVQVVFNHADYRLLSRRAIDALRQFGETNLFLRGIVPQLGFRSALVYYDRAERFAGESKYSLHRMIAFAWEGVTSFSAAPLRFITGLGMLISMGSFLITLWAIWIRMFTDVAVPGWASTVVPIYLLGGVQLLCIGIIGEYIAKIYAETKRRPRYFIEAMAPGARSDAAESGDLPAPPRSVS